jgi:hypothetical protein
METAFSELALNKDCPICLEEMNSKVISVLNCSHIICEACFKSMINFSNKCPLCLKVFTSCLNKEGSVTLSEFLVTEMELDKITQQRNSVYMGIILNYNSQRKALNVSVGRISKRKSSIINKFAIELKLNYLLEGTRIVRKKSGMYFQKFWI